LIYLKYYGVIDITPELSAILGGSQQSKTTDFGNSCTKHQSGVPSLLLTTLIVIHVTFESGSERYKELETGVFVGAGRFVIETDRPGVGVEYKISKVVKG
jgi:Protein of unknown function (DUF3237)